MKKDSDKGKKSSLQGSGMKRPAEERQYDQMK